MFIISVKILGRLLYSCTCSLVFFHLLLNSCPAVFDLLKMQTEINCTFFPLKMIRLFFPSCLSSIQSTFPRSWMPTIQSTFSSSFIAVRLLACFLNAHLPASNLVILTYCPTVIRLLHANQTSCSTTFHIHRTASYPNIYRLHHPFQNGAMLFLFTLVFRSYTAYSQFLLLLLPSLVFFLIYFFYTFSFSTWV